MGLGLTLNPMSLFISLLHQGSPFWRSFPCSLVSLCKTKQGSKGRSMLGKLPSYSSGTAMQTPICYYPHSGDVQKGTLQFWGTIIHKNRFLLPMLISMFFSMRFSSVEVISLNPNPRTLNPIFGSLKSHAP